MRDDIMQKVPGMNKGAGRRNQSMWTSSRTSEKEIIRQGNQSDDFWIKQFLGGVQIVEQVHPMGNSGLELL